MKILVIANPIAAGGKALRLLPKMKRWLSMNPHEFLFRISQSPDEMRYEINNAPARGIEGVLLAGGDGTLHEALPAIWASSLPFGMLPCGRGNDFARNIGLPMDINKNCNLPSQLILKAIDLPTINNIPFGSIACIGFDATVNALARDKKGYFHGQAGYIVCLLKALRQFEPCEVEITVDRFLWRGRITMVAVANGICYGGGMRIAPKAIMDDGELNICVVKEVSTWILLREFPKVYRGTHVSHPKVIMTSGKKIRIVSEESRDIFADGEYIGKLPGECTIGNHMIQIITPH